MVYMYCAIFYVRQHSQIVYKGKGITPNYAPGVRMFNSLNNAKTFAKKRGGTNIYKLFQVS